nr:MAG TPA: hypothetical protein [Caudoviricetes sp.]
MAGHLVVCTRYARASACISPSRCSQTASITSEAYSSNSYLIRQ